MNIPEQMQSKFWKVVLSCVSFLSILILFLAINQIKVFIQPMPSPAATNTITVSGEGDAVAKPDIATFSFGVTETAKEVGDAQTAATTKTNLAIAAVKAGGVADDDIQTLSYNINPHYEYTGGVCNGAGYCTPSKSTITGYDVSQTIQVKVRDLTKAGALLAAVGSLNVQNIDSLRFSIDKPESVQEQARTKAIIAAQTKADALAKELGVHIVRVVNFSENSGNVVSPMMYSMKTGAVANADVAAPSIPAGQQKVTSDVSITYEIR